MSNPAFKVLRREQLDDRLGQSALLRDVVPPGAGWIATLRLALGMTLRQLAARLGVSHQAVADLEHSERSGTITLASLRRAAHALDCDVVVALVPRTTLEDTVDRQIRAKERETRDRVAHTMALEAQTDGTDATLGEGSGALKRSPTRLPRRLWD